MNRLQSACNLGRMQSGTVLLSCGSFQRLYELDERREPRGASNLYVAHYLGDRSLSAAELQGLLKYFMLKGTRFAHNILPSLTAAFETTSDGVAVARKTYEKEPLFGPFGRRSLWLQRIGLSYQFVATT